MWPQGSAFSPQVSNAWRLSLKENKTSCLNSQRGLAAITSLNAGSSYFDLRSPFPCRCTTAQGLAPQGPGAALLPPGPGRGLPAGGASFGGGKSPEGELPAGVGTAHTRLGGQLPWTDTVCPPPSRACQGCWAQVMVPGLCKAGNGDRPCHII